MTADELLHWRQARGLTQTAAAELLNTPRPTYRRWEQGVSPAPGILDVATWALDQIQPRQPS